MGIANPPRDNQGRPEGPSLWADESADDALSLLVENALRGDEPAPRGDDTDDIHSLVEENARLRELLVQLSDLIRGNIGDASNAVSWQNSFDLRVRAGREMITLGLGMSA
jgi:hypothetical protein